MEGDGGVFDAEAFACGLREVEKCAIGQYVKHGRHEQNRIETHLSVMYSEPCFASPPSIGGSNKTSTPSFCSLKTDGISANEAGVEVCRA